jgi:ATP-dependent DNA helicase RecG
LPLVPARNRRIGALLKEMKLAEERGTGMPKIRRTMKQNGSPAPELSFDRNRTYFTVTLPAHPEYVAQSTLRDFAYYKGTGDDEAALRILQQAWNGGQRSIPVAMSLLRELASMGDLEGARRVVNEYPEPTSPAYGRLLTSLGTVLAEAGDESNATVAFGRADDFWAELDALQATLDSGGEDQRVRPRKLSATGGLVLHDPRAGFEFARTKLSLANDPDAEAQFRQRLLNEAAALLERVVQMEPHRSRRAWAWYELGRTRHRLTRPQFEVIDAFEHAVVLAPSEQRFVDELARARAADSAS